MRKLRESLEAEEERNIYIRIGLKKSEWDKLGALGVGRPHEAAERVLELVLRRHRLLVQKGLDESEALNDS